MSAGSRMNHFAPDHALSLLGSLHAQMKAGEFCDVTLCVATRKFQAHKNVLAAASPYFHAMFAGGLVESQEKVIDIYGTSEDIFEMLLLFIYTGDLDITEECCQDLLSASDLFGISDVLEACCNYLQQQIDPSNCLGIYTLAEAHCCVDLKQFTDEYICSHFVDISKEEEFSNLRKDQLVHFLNNEHLNIDNEIQVFNAAFQWIMQDLPNRRPLVFEVMNSVRFPVISQSLLERTIDECKDLVLKIAVQKFAPDFSESFRRTPQSEILRKSKPYLFEVRKGARRKIMAFGGYNRAKGAKWNDGKTLSSVETLDIYHLSWKVVPQFKYSRSAHGTVVLNGRVYILGGESDSLIYDNVECYDPVTNKWLVAPCMTVPRSSLGAAVIDDCIYVMGGWIGSEIGTTIERFSPAMNAWSQVDKMPLPRASMATVAFEGLIYVLGGVGDLNTETSLCESYNPVTKEWCELSCLVTRRSCLSACAGEDCLYAVGGRNKEDGLLDTVEKYDINKDKWTTLTEMPSVRSGAACICLNKMLYVFGGLTSVTGTDFNSYTLDTVDCFDIETKSWFTVDHLNMGRCDLGIAVI